VKRPVAVCLRLRDVVVEFPRERGPQVVHQPERGVTVLDALDEDANRTDVVERVDTRVLASHLVPDAVDVLRSSGNVGVQPGRCELVLERRLDVFDVVRPVEAALIDQLGDLLVGMRFERAKRKILELPFELPDAEPVSERREQILRFARGLQTMVALAADQKPQRLRAFRKLDEHHANVADHGQQHLAQILGLDVTVLFRCDADLRCADRTHARDAGDQMPDVGAEFFRKLLAVEAIEVGSADQDRRAHRIRIELESGHDRRSRERAVEPGFSIRRAAVAIERSRVIRNRGDDVALCRRERVTDLRIPRGQRFGRRAFGRATQDGNHAPIIRWTSKGP
jgi:hypothetical protein